MNHPSTEQDRQRNVGTSDAKEPAPTSLESTLELDARKLVAQVRGIPQRVERELKERPYRLLGIAGAVGFGVGAMFGSRVVRMMLVTAGGYGVNEVLRASIKRYLDSMETSKP